MALGPVVTQFWGLALTPNPSPHTIEKLKHANVKHRTEMKKKLSNLRSKNLKEYWKILNTNIDKQRCYANLHDLYSFFKTLE